jgi:hypothetical protein
MAGAIAASAGPLQRNDVPSDPAWVAHVDCDALRQTTIGKQLLIEMDRPEAQKKFAAVQAIFNVDPRKDLHGVTLYSTTKAEPDGVMLAYADFDAERLVTLVAANKDYAVTTHGAHQIHSWIDENKKAKDGVKPRTYGAIHKGKVIVLGQKESRVAETLEVLDHRKPGLSAGGAFAGLGVGGKATFLVGAARALDLPGNDPGAAVLKQAKMIWLSAGETQDKAELKLNLETQNADTAKQVSDVCRGLVAVLALQTDKPDAVKLAQAITVESEAANILVKLALPASEVAQMIRDKSEKKSPQ